MTSIFDDDPMCRVCDDRPWTLHALTDDGEHMLKVCETCLSKVDGETFASPFPIIEFPTMYHHHA